MPFTMAYSSVKDYHSARSPDSRVYVDVVLRLHALTDGKKYFLICFNVVSCDVDVDIGSPLPNRILLQ